MGSLNIETGESQRDTRHIRRRKGSYWRRKSSMRRFLHVLREEKITPYSLEPEDIEELTATQDLADDSWRHEMSRVLHSVPVAVVIVILVVIDCLFVIGELFIDITIYTDIKSVRVAECNAQLQAVLSSSNTSVSNASSATSPPVAVWGGGMASEDYALLRKIAASCHKGSIIVLSLFCLEIILRFIAMGQKRFFKSKIEVFDAAVVLISLVMDIIAFHKWDGLDFLIFLFVMVFWRFVRIFNTLLATYKRRLKLRYELQRLARRRGAARLRDTEAKWRTDREELRQVMVLAKVKGASQQELRRCRQSLVSTRDAGLFSARAVTSVVSAAGLMVPDKAGLVLPSISGASPNTSGGRETGLV